MYRALGTISTRTLPLCGVYMITNTSNGKCYIGSSVNMSKRLCQHRALLARGKHHNIHLQRAYDKYGEASFVVEDVAICEPSSRIETENKWLDSFLSNSYNIATRADCPSQRHLSEETRKKISDGVKKGMDKHQRSEALKKRWQTLEWRLRMKEIHANRHYCPSPESIEKMKATMKGRFPAGRVPWNKGKETPKEVRHKQSLARLGKEPANKGKKWDKEKRKYV